MKKKLALLLAISMLASMAVPAAAETVIGEGDVKNAIIEYQIPIKLNFALDAFQKVDPESESQIWSTDFPIINKSDVPLQAVVKTYVVDTASTDSSLTAPANTTVVTSPSEVNQTDIAVTTAQAYLEVVPALTINAKVATDGAYVANKSNAATIALDSSVTDVLDASPFTDGDTSAAGAKIEIDLSGVTGDMILDTNVSPNFATYELVIYGGTAKDVEVGRVTSAAITPTAGKVDAAALDAAFKGKEFTFTGGDVKEITMAITTDDAGKLTATNKDTADFDAIYTSAPTDLKVVLQQTQSKPANVVYDGATNPTYAEYSMATGAASPAKETVVAYVDGSTENMTPLKFILDRAPYDKAFADSEDKTVLSGVDPDTNVAGFRLMGSLNPMADWDTGKFNVAAVFDMNGVTTTAYNATEKYTTKDTIKVAKNVVVKVEKPSVATANQTISYRTGSGEDIAIPVSLGGGSKAAKGLSKVTLKAAGATSVTNLTSTAYTFDAASSTLKFDSTKNKTTFFDKLKTGGANELEITFNDKDATKVTIEITIS